MANKLLSARSFKTGTGATITLPTLIAIYSLAMVASLPGLAVSPILADLHLIFPNTSDFELQMLESLPSLVIIPFILLSGKLSLYISIRKLVLCGLAIFSASSIIYLLPINMGLMLLNSALLGIGAGLIIPFTTGLIAHYFTGSIRTQQLGIVSAISNLSLVIATVMAGYLANVNWHMSFLVYCVSLVSLILATRMSKINKTVKEKAAEVSVSHKNLSLNYIKKDWPISLMVFFFVTVIVALSIPMNLSLFMEHYKIGSSTLSGTLISIFFLSIALPGFFINKLVGKIKNKNNLFWLGIIIVGILLVMIHSVWSVAVGVVLMGLGYGVIQPLIYDRTSERASIKRVTFHLSLVMSMNYLAIILYPFIQELTQYFVGDSVMVPLYISIVLGAGCWLYYLNLLVRKKKHHEPI